MKEIKKTVKKTDIIKVQDKNPSKSLFLLLNFT